MNAFCPNLSNPQVKSEFEELVQAVGEDAAYFLWNKNNGYSLESAPNGAPSRLFKDLVDYYSGNRQKALQTKGKTYLQQFKDQFGDWQSDIIKSGSGKTSVGYILKDDNSIDFDKLEEITDKYFNDAEESLFKKGRKTLRTRQEHHEGESNTLQHIQNVVNSAKNIDISDNLKQSLILAAALHDIAKPFHGGQLHGYQSVDVINSIFDDSISPLIKFAVKHHMMTTVEGSQFDQNDANKIIQNAIDNNLNLKDAIELLLALNTADIVRGRDLSKIDQYSNKTIKETIEQEIPYKRQLLNNAVNTLSTVNKRIDENGEPTIQSLKLPKRESTENVELFDKSLQRLTEQIDQGKFFGEYSEKLDRGEFVSSKDIVRHLIDDQYIPTDLKLLSSLMAVHDIPVMYDPDQKDDMTTHITKKGEIIISINPNAIKNTSNNYVARTFFHELVHALTVRELNNPNSKIGKNIRALYDKLKAHYTQYLDPNSRLYGLRDINEFVAEFLTNDQFKNLMLATAKHMDEQGSKTIRQRLKNFVNSIVKWLCNKTLFKSNLDKLQTYEQSLFEYMTQVNPIERGNFNVKDFNTLLKNSNPTLDIHENMLIDKRNLQLVLADADAYNAIGDRITKKASNKLNKMLDNHPELESRVTRNTTIKQERKEHKSRLEQDPGKRLDYITESIADMLDIRIKAVSATVSEEGQRQRIIQGLQAQSAALRSETINKLSAMSYFLNDTFIELINEAKKVNTAAEEIYRNGSSNMNDQQYISEMHDFFGVYQQIFKEFDKFMDLPAAELWVGENIKEATGAFKTFQDLRTRLDLAKNIVDKSISMLDDINQKNVMNTLQDLGESTHNATEFSNYIDEQMGDVMTASDSGIKAVMGSADASSDMLVRSITHLISKATNQAISDALTPGNNLLNLQAKLKHGHKSTDLYERDDNGDFTGNLVRKLNYGKFRRDYKKFLKQLNAKYSTEDEPLAPDNTVPPQNELNRRAWALERNEWLSAHCERKFTKEYYELFANLSAATYRARAEIQMSIREINRKYWNEQKRYYDYETVPEGMTEEQFVKQRDEDFIRLNELQAQKKQLASIYDSSGNEKPIGTEPRIIADELTELNKKLYSSNRAARDMSLWMELRSKVIEECGGEAAMKKGRYINDGGRTIKNPDFNWKKLDEWDARNSRVTFKPTADGEGIQLFADIDAEKNKILEKYGVSLNYGEEYESNQQQIRDLLNPYRNKNTGEVDNSILPQQIKNKIRQLSKRNNQIRKNAKDVLVYTSSNRIVEAALQKKIKKELADVFNRFAKSEYTNQYLQMMDAARKQDLLDAEKNGSIEMEDMYSAQVGGPNMQRFLASTGDMIFDFEGNFIKFIPYQYYTKVVPLNYDKYVEVVPGDNFIIQDEESSFVNKNFDESEDETLVPKKSGEWNGEKFSYDNSEQYEKIQKNKDLKDLYDAVLKMNEEVCSIYYNLPFLSKYKLPNITGDKYDQVGRRHMFTKLKEMFTRNFKITENDFDYNKKVATKPDGSALNFIPQPYTAELEDPSMISADLVGITYLYYLKAQEYKQKEKIQPQCNAILDYIANRKYKSSTGKVKSGKDTNSYKLAKHAIESNLYEMSNKSAFGSKIISKTIGNFRRQASAMNLGLNPKVGIVGLLSTWQAHFINAIVGKRYDVKIGTYAAIELMLQFVKSMFGHRLIGNRSPMLQQNLNEYYNLTGQSINKFRNTNRNRYVNALMHNWVYGIMTTSDWIIKSQILDSVLLSFRFVDGEFITKDQLVYKYYKRDTFNGGEEYRKKKKEYDKAISLYAVLKKAHNTKSTSSEMFVIPKEYKQAADAVRNTVMSRAQKFSAQADGTMTPAQKSWISTTWWGALIMMHRQYLPVMIQERFGELKYDLDTQEYTYGSFRMVVDMLFNPIKDGWNAYQLLNNVQDPDKKVSFFKKAKAASKAFGRGVVFETSRSVVDPINRWELKRLLAEVAFHKLVVVPIVLSLVAAANDPDNDDNYLLQWIAYCATAFMWESFTPYRPADLFNNIKNVSAASSLLDAVGQFSIQFQFTNPDISLSQAFLNVFGIDTLTEEEEDKNIIKSGAYKGWTKNQRAWFKILFPFHNVYEQYKNSEAKRRYYEKQVMKQ